MRAVFLTFFLALLCSALGEIRFIQFPADANIDISVEANQVCSYVVPFHPPDVETDCNIVLPVSARRDYRLNGTYADSLGNPDSLIANGGTLTLDGYEFGPNQGLSLDLPDSLFAEKYAVVFMHRTNATAMQLR